MLEEARNLGCGRWCFPAPRGAVLRAISVRRVANAAAAASPHGLRTSFRSWCVDEGVDAELAEAALAHRVRNPVAAAYQRSDLVERRREVMERWGECITR